MIIKTPTRLHMGIIDISRKFPREYGALGMMVKGGFEIKVEKNDHLSIKATKENATDIKAAYDAMKSELKIDDNIRIEVEKSIPRHMGLGSTTQLKLAVGAGIARLSNHNLSITELADIVGRGRYSAIGTYGFDKGGFILEGGKSSLDEIPPLTAHYEIPNDWRFLMIFPKIKQSYDEEEEKPIMDDIRIDSKFTEKICHHIVMGVLPSVKTGSYKEFGKHITQIQHFVGESFSSYQQGSEFHPAVINIEDKLEKLTFGAGQSSWGPTVYGITNEENGDKAKAKIEKWLDKKKIEARVKLAEPDNEGAEFTD